jgi:outer membrane usher protein
VNPKAISTLVKALIVSLFLLVTVKPQVTYAADFIDKQTVLSNENMDSPERLFLSIEVNRRIISGLFYAEQDADARLILEEAAWIAANLNFSGPKSAMGHGRFGYDIASLKGARYVVDYQLQSLKIDALANSFGISNLSKPLILTDPINKSALGAYLNYNLTSTKITGNQAVNNHAAFIEGVVFNQHGSFLSGLVLSSLNGRSRRIRGQTYFQKDRPLSMEKLIIGDAISSAGAWSRPVRFGGVLWSTDFSLQQGFISAARPSINGSAALPSTIDILINNQKRQSDSVNAGPFEIVNFPTVTGAGQINVVVKDILGVETLTTQRYYATPRLLKAGLNEFSFEAGMERRNYGYASNAYNKPFVAETYRHGRDGYTMEVRTELQAARQALGIGVAGLIQQYAVMHYALAASNTNKQAGLHQIFGIERVSKSLNLNFQIEHYDQGFLQMGALTGEIKPRQKLLMGLGVNFYRNLWISHNLISQSSWNSDTFKLASANLSIPLIDNINLNVYVRKQFGQNKDLTGGLNINIPFSNGRNAAISSIRNAEGATYSNIELNQGIVNGTGVGYRIRASDDPAQQLLASLSARTPVNMMTLDAGQSQSNTSMRFSTSGTLGILGGLSFASQNIGHGSFAVIKVSDEANIDVYLSNRKIARTNSNGLALLPNLLPYQQNKVSIRAEDLPFDLNINKTTLLLNPFARSGLFASMDVKKTNNRLIRLLNTDGTFIPMGTKVHVMPSNTHFFVAKRGEVYLTDLNNENSLVVASQEKTCYADLTAPVTSTDKHAIITVTCRS